MLDRNDVLDILKEEYPAGLDSTWLYKSHPFIARLKRKRDLQARVYHLPIKIAKQNGVSHDSSIADTHEAGSEFDAFVVTPPVVNHARMRLDKQLVRMSKESPESAARFINVFKDSLEDAMKSFGDRMAKEAMGAGGGSLARIGSLPDATTIALADIWMVHFFEVGMRIQLSANDGTDAGHTLRASGAIAEITGIDDEAGLLQFNEPLRPLSGITGAAANDYIFAAGDFKAAAKGYEAWCTKTKPGLSDSFYGVPRGRRPIFAGIRYDGAAAKDTFETVWTKADLRMRRFGIANQPIHISPRVAARMSLTKEGLKEVTGSSYEFGIDTFVAPNGKKFILDDDMEETKAFQFDPESFWYVTNGDQPKLDNYDGLEIVREANTYRVDFVVDYLFMSPNPTKLGRIELPSTGLVG